MPPGPDNPLGKHWLGLSIHGYGIHGTIAPSSIYQFRTHGCIRLHPDDIAELFLTCRVVLPESSFTNHSWSLDSGAKCS